MSELSDTLGRTPARQRRRPLVHGHSAVPLGGVTHNRPKLPEIHKYPFRSALSSLQREVLSLVEIRPRTTTEVADALAIEWPTAEHTLSQLANRLHLIRVPGQPTTWRLRG